MKLVTRDVDPDSMRDLLERVPRACLSFASEHGPQTQPVGLIWHEDRYLVSMLMEAEYQPVSGQEVVLLVDEGVYYFDLRAIYIRGRVKISEAPPDAPAGRKWFEVVPIKTAAWDYGTMREVENER
jgi:hypothetical protein